MDYSKHYNTLIERAKTRLLESYSERHHIIPRCMGGSDEQNNIVRLTAEEHYVAHQLLIKIYPNNFKLIYAAHKMTSDPHGHRVNNKLYGWLRQKANAIPVSKETRRKMSIARKKRVHTAESNVKRAKALKGRIITTEHRMRISESLSGYKHSEEHRRNNSEAQKGKTSSRKGIKQSTIECPKCSKSGGYAVMKRWHFENCNG